MIVLCLVGGIILDGVGIFLVSLGLRPFGVKPYTMAASGTGVLLVFLGGIFCGIVVSLTKF